MNVEVFMNEKSEVIIRGDEQEITVCEETAKSILIRLCSLHNWHVKPNGTKFGDGFAGIANSNLKEGLIPTS